MVDYGEYSTSRVLYSYISIFASSIVLAGQLITATVSHTVNPTIPHIQLLPVHMDAVCALSVNQRENRITSAI